eukprot:scaffold3955_cov160-Cylindrotheca_fusiformis.AAC.13
MHGERKRVTRVAEQITQQETSPESSNTQDSRTSDNPHLAHNGFEEVWVRRGTIFEEYHRPTLRRLLEATIQTTEKELNK